MTLGHVVLAVAVLLMVLIVQVERLITLLKREMTPQWTMLPHPIHAIPHCGHGNQIHAVHSSGNTRCHDCAVIQ